MAIETMKMINLIGHVNDLDMVTKLAVLSKAVHLISAVQEIDSTDFTLSTTEDNMEQLIDVCYIRPFMGECSYSNETNCMKVIKEVSNVKNSYGIKEEELIFKSYILKSNILDMYNQFNKPYEELCKATCEQKKLEGILEHLSYLKDVEVTLKELKALKNFNCQMYKISKENSTKLKENYENVPSIVIKIYKQPNYEVIMVFTPRILITEANRIFKSLNCEEVKIPEAYNCTPLQIIAEINKQIQESKNNIKEIESRLSKLSKDNEKYIKILDRSLELEIRAQEVKNSLAYTKEFFYLCGWIPKSSISDFKRLILAYTKNIIIIEKDAKDINSKLQPPTKLKNNFVVKPFEALVGMYGIPSYGESDPTVFLGLSYMFMFGAMFGDLGQGMVFIIVALLLNYKKFSRDFSGILLRLGISSSIFGGVYGSVFGFEDVIPALIIRPMENIKETLLYALIFGCGLLIIGFIYSLINNVKKRNLEDGLFGKDGVAGLVFYLSALLFTLKKVENIKGIIPDFIWILLLLTTLLLILLKEPLANLILKKRPLYKEKKSDYFIEGGFGTLETILSMFSNTLSFIRVGAFALNHVGLFLAFAALAKMIQSGIGGFIMYVIGNIIIIALEGLIVFIQGLRLEYYELFSKYYEGAGISFNPVELSSDSNL